MNPLNLLVEFLDTSKWRAFAGQRQVCALALTEAADVGVVFAASDAVKEDVGTKGALGKQSIQTRNFLLACQTAVCTCEVTSVIAVVSVSTD